MGANAAMTNLMELEETGLLIEQEVTASFLPFLIFYLFFCLDDSFLFLVVLDVFTSS